jgi:hypothetical protein
MLIIQRSDDIQFLDQLRVLLAGWSGRAISGDERDELATRLGDVLTRALRTGPGACDFSLTKPAAE